MWNGGSGFEDCSIRGDIAAVKETCQELKWAGDLVDGVRLTRSQETWPGDQDNGMNLDTQQGKSMGDRKNESISVSDIPVEGMQPRSRGDTKSSCFLPLPRAPQNWESM